MILQTTRREVATGHAWTRKGCLLGINFATRDEAQVEECGTSSQPRISPQQRATRGDGRRRETLLEPRAVCQPNKESIVRSTGKLSSHASSRSRRIRTKSPNPPLIPWEVWDHAPPQASTPTLSSSISKQTIFQHDTVGGVS